MDRVEYTLSTRCRSRGRRTCNYAIMEKGSGPFFCHQASKISYCSTQAVGCNQWVDARKNQPRHYPQQNRKLQWWHWSTYAGRLCKLTAEQIVQRYSGLFIRPLYRHHHSALQLNSRAA